MSRLCACVFFKSIHFVNTSFCWAREAALGPCARMRYASVAADGKEACMVVIVNGVKIVVEDSSTLAKLLRAKLARTLGLKPSVIRALEQLGLSQAEIEKRIAQVTAKRKQQQQQ